MPFHARIATLSRRGNFDQELAPKKKSVDRIDASRSDSCLARMSSKCSKKGGGYVRLFTYEDMVWRHHM